MRKLEYYRLLAELNILLIESDIFLRDALRRAFGNIGCIVDATGSAEEGFDLLGEGTFDIIIVDIDLPGIDGLEFFHRLGAQCRRSLKVIIAGYGDIDPVSTAREYGIDQIFEKPFALTTVLDALAGHVTALKGPVKKTG
jgi:DNA-binding response OmpR family regulator